jgi:hypothetical protein
MHYIIYKITNQINKRYYIGRHATKNVNDSYMRSEQYIYRITTNTGEEYIVNGLEFKKLCVKKDWNYNTLHWKKSMGKYISRGKHEGFLVEQISTYKEVVI